MPSTTVVRMERRYATDYCCTSSWTMKYGYSTATLSLSVPRYQSGGYKI